MNELAWWWPLSGGLLIGLSAALYLLLTGRVAGISGIAAQAIGVAGRGGRSVALGFLAGLLGGSLLAIAYIRQPQLMIEAPIPLLVIGGLLVGFGTRLGAGCTSGHGVCGLSRLSRRSLIATCTFMAVAGLVVFLMRHAFSGGAA